MGSLTENINFLNLREEYFDNIMKSLDSESRQVLDLNGILYSYKEGLVVFFKDPTNLDLIKQLPYLLAIYSFKINKDLFKTNLKEVLQNLKSSKEIFSNEDLFETLINLDTEVNNRILSGNIPFPTEEIGKLFNITILYVYATVEAKWKNKEL